MTENDMPLWLKWAREIQAISQTGLAFSQQGYDTLRYSRLLEIASEIIESHSDLPKERVLENFLVQQGYATAKIDVRGAIIRNGKVLLVQERSDQKWCMPGGWADVGDIPSEMVAREVLEESGFEVAVKKVIGVFDANRSGRPLEFYHAYKIVFLCQIQGGEARPSDETAAVDFFSFEDLPQLSVNRTNERHLREVLAHLNNIDRPTAFD